jgi:hypothetical protein
MADEFIPSEADTLESQRLARLFRDNVFSKVSDTGSVPGVNYVEGQVIVSFVPDVSNDEIQRIATAYGLTVLENIPYKSDRTVVYSYDTAQWPNIYDLIRAVWGENMGPNDYGDNSGPYTGSVKYAQPQYIYRTADSTNQINVPSVSTMSTGMIIGIALVLGLFIYAKR